MRGKGQRGKRIFGPEAWESCVSVEGKQRRVGGAGGRDCDRLWAVTMTVGK